MATQTTNIAGSGYGNPYIDALISGAGWTNTILPIRYAFMSGAVSAADSPTGVTFTAPAWSYLESDSGLVYAINALQAVCGVSFTRLHPTEGGADLQLWKLPGTTQFQHDALGAGVAPIDAFYGSQATYWPNSYSSLWAGSYAYAVGLKQLGYVLGLADPHTGGTEGDRNQFPGVTDGQGSALGTDGLNQGIWTMMSANFGWTGAQHQGAITDYAGGWQATPMAFDIAALQRMYGANMSTRPYGDVYGLYSGSSGGWTCIWDAGGVDSISAASSSSNAYIDLRAAPLVGPNAGGYVSRVFGSSSGFTIANGVVIENAYGGSGNDTLIGNDANNTFTGGQGNDTIDGGAGVDTASFTYRMSEYTIQVQQGQIIVAHTGPNSGYSYTAQGTDTLRNIEVLSFNNTFDIVSLANFNPLHYLALNPDLYAAWGLNTDMALQHYLTHGRLEGRQTYFDGLAYIASYPDLMAAFGTNTDAALHHYMNLGIAEGRRITFDPMRYLASHADLIRAFGNDPARAAAHYITDGFAEGRRITFDGMSYIASYADLRTTFGTNAALATQHYVTNGFAEGRRVTFDAVGYLASHTDLLTAFGPNTTLAAQHYITNGRAEGRGITFDAMKYIASHGDVITAFGTDTATAKLHYITNGFREGRGLSFDAEFYMAKHADVQAALVDSLQERRIAMATQHYITNGFAEGRVATSGGDDILVGSAMAESINGGAGNDRVTGGGGRDLLTGGIGADTFVYTAVSDLNIQQPQFNERITDFLPGVDKIDLSAIDANTATPEDDAFTVLLGHLAAFTAPGQMRLDINATYGHILWGNVDADIDAEFAIVLTGAPAITLADFVL